MPKHVIVSYWPYMEINFSTETQSIGVFLYLLILTSTLVQRDWETDPWFIIHPTQPAAMSAWYETDPEAGKAEAEKAKTNRP